MPRQPRSDKEWLERLDSDDESLVISALHSACPCNHSPERYEEYKELLARFQKDPRPNVRKTALHLEYDAFEEMKKEDELAAGHVRNRAGGNARRGGRRRDAQRRVGLRD